MMNTLAHQFLYHSWSTTNNKLVTLIGLPFQQTAKQELVFYIFPYDWQNFDTYGYEGDFNQLLDKAKNLNSGYVLNISMPKSRIKTHLSAWHLLYRNINVNKHVLEYSTLDGNAFLKTIQMSFLQVNL